MFRILFHLKLVTRCKKPIVLIPFSKQMWRSMIMEPPVRESDCLVKSTDGVAHDACNAPSLLNDVHQTVPYRYTLPTLESN